MFDILTVALLTALAVALNSYAARRADRSGNRRTQQELDWHRMIRGAMRETALPNDD